MNFSIKTIVAGGYFAVSCFLFALTGAVQANEFSAYEKFFADFDHLSKNYDQKVVALYRDDAIIKARRIAPNGQQQNMQMDGTKWKVLLADLMPFAQKRGDRSDFSNVRYTNVDGGVKISAQRYSHLKCYTDNYYYLVVKPDAQGQLKISEEFMESLVTSNCENAKDDSLALMLEATEVAIRKHLPVMVDQDTQLFAVSATGETLKYEYALINVAANEIDAQLLQENLVQHLTQQTCTMPNLKPMVDKGATIEYVYRAKDFTPVAQVRLNKSHCR